jgi:hypothetical protein
MGTFLLPDEPGTAAVEASKEEMKFAVFLLTSILSQNLLGSGFCLFLRSPNSMPANFRRDEWSFAPLPCPRKVRQAQKGKVTVAATNGKKTPQ